MTPTDAFMFSMTSETTALIVSGIGAGFVATVTMDVLGSVSLKIGLTAGARAQWIGRWYLGIARGRFTHSNIAASPERSGEMRAALLGHYVIGIVLGVLYVVGTAWVSVSPGALPVALGYGVATCVFPWFLMFPALGFGLLGLKGPPELRLLSTSLINHLLYGLGLWWIAKVLPLG